MPCLFGLQRVERFGNTLGTALANLHMPRRHQPFTVGGIISLLVDLVKT